MGIKVKVTLGVVAGIVALGACSASTDDKGGNASSDKGTSVTDTADKKADKKSGKKPEKKAAGSQADQFKAFVNKNGSAKEKAAVAHITKVQGAEKLNNVMDTADIYTDFTGGLMGKGAAPSELITSAFKDWKHSDNGLVTVYDATGETITNSEF
ncbi:hypothetical protein [Streptomyces sp. NPDC050738]|uniref:hypothetical protein n=1 Tax=Streptomyces sp. NPDC050738 TaxID=3154744 RepID=UPI00342E0B7F